MPLPPLRWDYFVTFVISKNYCTTSGCLLHRSSVMFLLFLIDFIVSDLVIGAELCTLKVFLIVFNFLLHSYHLFVL